MSNKECKCYIPNTDLAGRCFICGGFIVIPASNTEILPEGELPVQLLESIANEAKEVAKEKCGNRTYSYTKGYEDGYFIGATSYVEWKVKYDELKRENEYLKSECKRMSEVIFKLSPRKRTDIDDL